MVTPEVIDFIKKQKAQSVPQEHYRALLLSQGWVMADIELAEAQTNPMAVPLPPPIIDSHSHSFTGSALGILEILVSLPVLGQIVLSILVSFPVYFHFSYPNIMPYGQAGFLQVITVAFVKIQPIGIISFTLLIMLLIMGIVCNLILQKKRGMKLTFLQKTNRYSVLIICLFVLAWASNYIALAPIGLF